VKCSGSGTTLIRTELEMAGWKAYVNGKSVNIKVSDGVYQAIKVPAGTSTVTYAFFPPHERYAIIVGFLAALYLIGAWIDERRNRGKDRRRRRLMRLRLRKKIYIESQPSENEALEPARNEMGPTP
jgi:hypothetical protein